MLHRPAPISSNIDSYIIPEECVRYTCVERNHNTPCLNVYNVASSSTRGSGSACRSLQGTSRCGFSDEFVDDVGMSGATAWA